MSIISEDLFMLICCPDRHKTQRMRDEAVDDGLAALKFIPDWFVALLQNAWKVSWCYKC